MRKGTGTVGASRAAAWSIAAGCALFPLAVFLYVALSRAGYPLDLEWVEGSCVAMANRFARGLPLYEAPSIRGIALPYFPLYFVLTGLLFKITGPVYWAGRLLSLGATLGTGGLLFWIVRRETRQSLAGLIAAGMWFAAFGYCGFFYDLNRVDALAAFFLAGAFAAAFGRSGARAGALAGALLAASALTKQNHAAFMAPLLFALALRGDWRSALAAAAAFALGFLPAVGLLDRSSGGMFTLLTLKLVPFGVTPGRVDAFFLSYLRHFPLSPALAVAGAVLLARQRSLRAMFGNPWLGLWLSGTALSLIFQLHPAGYINANIPAAFAASLAAGVFGANLAEWGKAKFAALNRPVAVWLAPVIAASLNAELNALAVLLRVMLRGLATSGKASGFRAFP